MTGQAAWFDLRVRITRAGVRTRASAAAVRRPAARRGADDGPLRYGADFRRQRDSREASS